ncbi:hypothetical protein MF271_00795 (plasmid) [Deinococcus sp. KNUC1210]|uniref:hypothetical protein n=1 Tax=Deinococcus sp. KNUC1210 TaxID=2917691 RepID=UPI001EF01264|nr:hypothetical protein [Deinococcus sp. KNUC1210]ULH14049.1 hypothetical protein MF271_00795 [Deinococcus sp. KNUC1210]
MNVMMVRAKVRAEKVADLESSLKTMFAALERTQPQGVQYASSRLPDGTTFVILLALAQEPHNPLSTVPEFRAFQEGLRGWLSEPPVAEQLTVVGSYRLF